MCPSSSWGAKVYVPGCWEAVVGSALSGSCPLPARGHGKRDPGLPHKGLLAPGDLETLLDELESLQNHLLDVGRDLIATAELALSS